jgi:hypothetical protein
MATIVLVPLVDWSHLSIRPEFIWEGPRKRPESRWANEKPHGRRDGARVEHGAPGFVGYLWDLAWAKRVLISAQLTVFHQAAR